MRVTFQSIDSAEQPLQDGWASSNLLKEAEKDGALCLAALELGSCM
jgi:hypothetical protein